MIDVTALEPIAIEKEDDGTQVWARVDISNWQQAARIAKDNLNCNYFSFLSAIDWLPNPDLNGEKTYAPDRPDPEPQEVIVDPAIRKAGGESRFQVFACVYNIDTKENLIITADLDDSLTAPTWTPIYRGADWHERETWEMFGITFTDHPNLRHIYLPDEFEGFPLRKDYHLLAREVRPWPGLVDMEEMPVIAEESTGAQE